MCTIAILVGCSQSEQNRLETRAGHISGDQDSNDQFGQVRRLTGSGQCPTCASSRRKNSAILFKMDPQVTQAFNHRFIRKALGQLSISIINPKHSNRLVITGFEGCHDPFNYTKEMKKLQALLAMAVRGTTTVRNCKRATRAFGGGKIQPLKG